jgi:anti-sigma B factor antagonist
MYTTIATSQMTVVRPQGHLNAANASTLRHQLIAAVASSRSKMILVDMEQVESLDSSALMALVAALTQAQAQNQRFSLCSLSPSIRIIFDLTQLDRVFDIVENSAAFEAALHSKAKCYQLETMAECAA